MEHEIDITRFLDDDGRIQNLPKKRSSRCAVLAYLADKFGDDIKYKEREVNEIINEWHSFNDYFLLRRELVEEGLLMRERDGSAYWRVKA